MSLLIFIKSHEETRDSYVIWPPHAHPHPRGLNKSVVQIIMGLLVKNTVTYLGKHYLFLHFLFLHFILHVPIWLLWNLPPMQPENCQMSHLPASETLCWPLRAQKCKKAKWLSDEALQNSCEKKRSEKQRRKERYKHLNAEFQRIARRDKKAFVSDQCKEIEGKNRMGKTRDLFKKIRDTKRTFHAKMGSIKDRNGMDLTEAEDIKKRWQEYTEELLVQKRSSRPR